MENSINWDKLKERYPEDYGKVKAREALDSIFEEKDDTDDGNVFNITDKQLKLLIKYDEELFNAGVYCHEHWDKTMTSEISEYCKRLGALEVLKYYHNKHVELIDEISKKE